MVIYFAAKMVHSVSQMKFRECLRMQKMRMDL